ncbi:HAD hydrolase-like protein [Luteibacter sp. 9133]|uniref:HAD hydrolase-like protein n=1 Tax=Luteibacter sp. 9133 TaxID=1500891 RepID=UPI00068EE8F7|nr:HAD hydrolase-like protein [Luteibacter sp. 9133]
MEFDLLIFDLDNTLLRTDAVAHFRGAEFVDQQPLKYRDSLITHARASVTPIYPQTFFEALKRAHPQLRIGILTRAPRAYLDVLLTLFYPRFAFDATVAAREVAHPKPAPDGIREIARRTGTTDASRVAVIGDDKVDLQAAYRAGVWMVSEESAWPVKLQFDQYAMLERMPDARIKGPADLMPFLQSRVEHLPLMEAWAVEGKAPCTARPPRIEAINHFDRTSEKRAPVRIQVLGRRFRDDDDDKHRRAWHRLSMDIESLKNAETFPDYWIGTLRAALTEKARFAKGNHAVVTVVPAKPGREPRLEHLLAQLAQSHRDTPIRARDRQVLSFKPDVFAYLDGVRSHHGEYLNAAERFANVRDHFKVVNPTLVAGRSFIVLDDVTTSGATLFYAHHYLVDNGAASVILLSFTKAVSAQ